MIMIKCILILNAGNIFFECHNVIMEYRDADFFNYAGIQNAIER